MVLLHEREGVSDEWTEKSCCFFNNIFQLRRRGRVPYHAGLLSAELFCRASGERVKKPISVSLNRGEMV